MVANRWMNPDEASSAHTETRHTVRIASQMSSMPRPRPTSLVGLVCFFASNRNSSESR